MNIPAAIVALTTCLLPFGVARGVGAPAPTPQGPVEIESSTRARIVLNGEWKFQPAVGPAERAPADEMWGVIRVPGSWNEQGWPRAVRAIVRRGTGGAWDAFTGKRDDPLSRAWYERDIHVPAGWTDGEIALELSRVGTDAQVYVNGTDAGRIGWPGGALPITPLLRPGQSNTLRLCVAASSDAGLVERFMDADKIETAKATVQYPGVPGDVYLTRRPGTPRIDTVAIETSVRDETLKLTVTLTGDSLPTSLNVSAVATHRGVEQKRFAGQTVTVRASSDRSVDVQWPWPDATHWDTHQPFLYDLTVSVSGDGITDTVARTIGFREFRVVGKDFVLNGTPIRLRPYLSTIGPEQSEEAYRGFLTSLKAAGVNFVYVWPLDPSERGTRGIDPLLYDLADELGVLINGIAPSMQAAIGKAGEGWDAGGRERFAATIDPMLSATRRHASQVMWVTTGNFFAHAHDQNPPFIGLKGWLEKDGRWLERAVPGREGVELIRRADPTRPVMTHNGAYVGDVFTANTYLNFIPLQEREEWMSDWAAKGEMPFMAVEFGMPSELSFRRNRWGHNNADRSEPLMTEFAAAYVGPRAYAIETDTYREGIVAAHKSGDTYTFRKPAFQAEPAFQELQALFIRNTWRSWRAAGISGGMLPWGKGYLQAPDETPSLTAAPFVPGQRGEYHPKLSPAWTRFLDRAGGPVLAAGEAYREANAPTLAFIGGTPVVPDKSHHFRTGEVIEKQIVLINDERVALPFEAAWTVEGTPGGERVSVSATTRGTLDPSEIRRVPIRFIAANVDPEQSAPGAIRLTAAIGARQHVDSFAFKVFGPATAPRTVVSLIDPKGLSATLLKSLRIEAAPVDAATAHGGALARPIVIGREALSADPRLLERSDVTAHLRAGGSVIVLSQDPGRLTEQGFRTAPVVSRRAFAVDASHPVVNGLADVDLADWHGESTLMEAYPDYLNRPFRKAPSGMPYSGWRWGGRGGVSSAPIEKPHYGAYRAILECEFDLAFSPLLEQQAGPGRIIWCQLDLEDHAADPAAQRLLRQLLNYAATPTSLPPPGVTMLDGDDAAAATLDHFGVTRKPPGSSIPTDVLLVIGRGGTLSAEVVRQHARGGGRVLVLPQSDKAGKFDVDLLRAADARVAIPLPGWSACAGLSTSDLRARTPVPTWVLTGGCEKAADGLIGRQVIGNGEIVFVQFDPAMLDVAQRPYLRYSAWRWTRATSLVLANLGATITPRPSASTQPATTTRPVKGLYHADYREEFKYGDDPYRYFRW